jgi:hypothetical protein
MCAARWKKLYDDEGKMATKVIEPPSKSRREVKRSVRRLESKVKVDGSAQYIYNMSIPGMLML